jgi:hypothetical protein
MIPQSRKNVVKYQHTKYAVNLGRDPGVLFYARDGEVVENGKSKSDDAKITGSTYLCR